MPESRLQKPDTEHWLTRRREPHTYMLSLFMGGSVAVFLCLLLAYLIREHGKGWVDVALPRIFWASTLVIGASSFTMHAARRALRHERFLHYRVMLGSTLGLGILFVTMQVLGWHGMITAGVQLDKNLAGAFVYILSGLHLLHISVGLVALAILWVEALQRRSYIDSFVYSVNPPKQLRVKLAAWYWHFVDILWIGIFLFLLYHHQK